MSTRIKELNEKRGAKLKEASALITAAQTEKRELNAEQLETVAGLHAEADTIGSTIVAEARQLSFESANGVHLTKGETRDVEGFDYSRLLNHLHRTMKGHPSKIDGIEAEMAQEGEREAREAGIETGGIMLPRLLVRRGGAERRDVSATGTTTTTLDQGGMTIATNKAGLLDDFHNASVLRNAGATVLEGLVGNLDIPRIVKDATVPLKKTENEAAAEWTPTTSMLSLSPNRLPAFVDIGEQLLKQSSSPIEAVIRSALINEMLAVQEAAFFHGGGTSEANGIVGTTGIGDVAGDTDGAAPTLAHIIELETEVDTENALMGNLRYMSNGQIRGKLKQTPKVASTDSVMLLGESGLLNGYQCSWTNAISRTLTKGSSSLASAIVFGNFADYWIGYWGGISLEMIRDSASAKVGQFVLVAATYYDGGVVRPKSFAAMKDALGA